MGGVLRCLGGREAGREAGREVAPAPGNCSKLPGWDPDRPEKLPLAGLTPGCDWMGPLKNAGWSPLAVVTMQQLGGMLGGGRDRRSWPALTPPPPCSSPGMPDIRLGGRLPAEAPPPVMMKGGGRLPGGVPGPCTRPGN